jgi:predicted TIM-barrel fold metal-dependent hydrolase
MRITRRETLAAFAAVPFAGAVFAQDKKEPPAIPGPDPDTKTPAFKAPAGSVDTHCHIFGPASKYPYVASRPYTPPEAPLDMFRALHAKIGVERAVIVNATTHGIDHRVVVDAIAQSGGKYRGIVNVDESITDKELEALEAAGVRGCRFVFLARLGGKPDFSRVTHAAERVKKLNWHVDLYFEPALLDTLTPEIRALPTPYVIDHMGGIKAAEGLDQPEFKALVALAKSDEKCWIKITGPERMSAKGAPFTDAVPFAQELIEAAPDRVIWGTDWPHPNAPVMPNDGDLVDLVPLYAPDENQRHRLLVENPARLFRF